MVQGIVLGGASLRRKRRKKNHTHPRVYNDTWTKLTTIVRPLKKGFSDRCCRGEACTLAFHARATLP